MADVLGIQLEKVVSNEAAAIGSAMLAGVAVGLWASPQKASAAGVVVSEIIQPESGACLQYEPIYQGHRSLYPVLSPLYKP